MEENFTGEENFTLGKLSDVNMKTIGLHNVRRNRYIKGSDKYVILNISLKFSSLYKMIITFSEPKDNLEIPEKRLITSLGLKTKTRLKKYKK